MVHLIEQLAGGLAARRDSTGLEAGALLRRLARLRRRSPALGPALIALGGVVAISAALAGAAVLAAQSTGRVEVAATAPGTWIDVIRPMPVYDLGGTDFAKLPRGYQARRRAGDGTREDTMSFGSLDDGKPFLRISLARRGDGAPPADTLPLADALAHAAGAFGDTIAQVRPLPAIETRFGTLSRADLKLWHHGSATACTGFRGEPGGGDVMTLAGFACGPAGRPMPEATIACAIDRIDLVAAADDRPLRELFVAAERRPGTAACREGALANRLDPAPPPGPFDNLRRRAAWLESRSGGPPLRGAIGADDHEP